MSNSNPILTTDYTEVQREFIHVTNLVNQAFRQFVQQKLKQHKLDLTYEMLQVLGRLWEQDGINQQELANAVLKDKASLTFLIDNLTRRELVSRKEDLVDRRSKRIYLTPQGHQLKQIIMPWLEDMYATAKQNIDEPEFDIAMRVFRKLAANLKGY